MKQDLHSQRQRLFFQVPSNPELGEEDTVNQTQELLEDLTAGLKDWQVRKCASSIVSLASSSRLIEEPLKHCMPPMQAILYQGGKALGRLVQPTVASSVCSIPEPDSRANLLAKLQYHLWQPASQKGTPPQTFHILLDQQFRESSYKLKVFGQARGSLFPVPLPYDILGQRTAAAVSFQYQQQQYIRSQQLRWHTAEGTSAPSSDITTVTVVCGEHASSSTFKSWLADGPLF